MVCWEFRISVAVAHVVRCGSASSFPIVSQEVALIIPCHTWYMLLLDAYQVAKKLYFFL